MGVPQVHDVKDAALLTTKFSARHLARVFALLIRIDGKFGARVAAALLECMPPVYAAM